MQENNPELIKDTLEAQRIELQSARSAQLRVRTRYTVYRIRSMSCPLNPDKEKELLRLQNESYQMYQVEKMCLGILNNIITEVRFQA